MNERFTELLTVESVLQSDRYIIPLYQRNFAWEKEEVEQLLRDVYENNNPSYYIGTLVVAGGSINDKPFYEVIDGQQRLTALNIIYSILSIKGDVRKTIPLNLDFECREKSTSALKLLRERGKLDSSDNGSLDNFRAAERAVGKFCSDVLGNDPKRIARFLAEKLLRVNIFRVRLHPQTDKNHYFEVMNNRGEQLEAHEIVKSKLMDSLADRQEREVFATVWEACSDMNGHLQKNSTVRNLWGDQYCMDPLDISTFDELAARLSDGQSKESYGSAFCINNIESYTLSKSNPQEEKAQDRMEEEYDSVIDFPNFLLQVLATGDFGISPRMDASKFLLYDFGCIGNAKMPDARLFIVRLLRMRVLFDRFIIKRRKTARTARGWRWVIETLRYSGRLYAANTFGNTPNDDVDDTEDLTLSKQMCMLQAMFFVTFRRDVYMHWLTRALKAADKNPDGSTLLATLEKYTVDYIRESRPSDGIMPDEYKKGLATHHFIFNFLDYHLWYIYYCKTKGIANSDLEKYPALTAMLDRSGVREGFKYFTFTRRNSIEHYLAQEKGRHRQIPEETIDSFGNLALISGRLNSRLSNRQCSEKKEYHDSHNPASLKYELMLSEENWSETEIKSHGRLMSQILIDKSEGYFDEYDTPKK